MEGRKREGQMSDIIMVKCRILIDTADIQEVRGLEYMSSIKSEHSDKPKQASDVTHLSDYQGQPDEYLSGKYVVRVFLRSVKGQNSTFCPSTPTAVSKTPFIDIVCNNLSEAHNTYKNIQKSRHVVDINEMRYGR